MPLWLGWWALLQRPCWRLQYQLGSLILLPELNDPLPLSCDGINSLQKRSFYVAHLRKSGVPSVNNNAVRQNEMNVKSSILKHTCNHRGSGFIVNT